MTNSLNRTGFTKFKNTSAILERVHRRYIHVIVHHVENIPFQLVVIHYVDGKFQIAYISINTCILLREPSLSRRSWKSWASIYIFSYLFFFCIRIYFYFSINLTETLAISGLVTRQTLFCSKTFRNRGDMRVQINNCKGVQ